MKLLDVVCKELGVELGEEWMGNDGEIYQITGTRIIEWYEGEVGVQDYTGWIISDDNVYKRILEGDLKPTWRPNIGDTYYVPHLGQEHFYKRYIYEQKVQDIEYFNNGVMFKTEEEAIKCAKRMLEAIKGGILDE